MHLERCSTTIILHLKWALQLDFTPSTWVDFPIHLAKPIPGMLKLLRLPMTVCALCIVQYSKVYRLCILCCRDGFTYHNGMAFSTYDQDHDNDSSNCATQTWLAPGPNWFGPSCWDQFLMGQQTNWGELLYLLYQIQVTQLYTE